MYKSVYVIALLALFALCLTTSSVTATGTCNLPVEECLAMHGRRNVINVSNNNNNKGRPRPPRPEPIPDPVPAPAPEQPPADDADDFVGGVTEIEGMCFLNCEVFELYRRRGSNQNRPCHNQSSPWCQRTQLCKNCQNKLVMFDKMVLLNNAEDTVPRCPSFPRDFESFTDSELNTVRDICASRGGCQCVGGFLSIETVSVENEPCFNSKQ